MCYRVINKKNKKIGRKILLFMNENVKIFMNPFVHHIKFNATIIYGSVN